MSSATARAVISSVCAAVAVVITMAVIRRCRRMKKKMHKKFIAKIMDEINKKYRGQQAAPDDGAAAVDDVVIEIGPVEKFLHEILNEKPMRFSSEQLASYTSNYSSELGSGGFGVVYKGELPNGLQVAVKVLKMSMNKKVQEGFMAEISTIGRTYHVHLVRLYGFCFDRDGTKALVYEFLENGSLEKYMYRDSDGDGDGEEGSRREKLEWRTLHGIAVARRHSEGDPVPARGVPAEDRALRHQAGQHPPHLRLRPEGGRLRAGQARGAGEHAHVVADGRRARDARVRGAGAVDGAADDGEVRRVQLRHGAVRDPGPAPELRRRANEREPRVVPQVGVGQVRAGGHGEHRVRGRRRRGGRQGEGRDHVQGGAVVRPVPAVGAADDEQRGEDAGGRDGHRAAREPVPLHVQRGQLQRLGAVDWHRHQHVHDQPGHGNKKGQRGLRAFTKSSC